MYSVPEWVTNPRCAVSGGGNGPAPLRGSELTFTCPVALRPSPADPASPVVSCDFVGAEPVDVPLADLCRTRTLRLQRSTEITVTSEIAVDLTVEWVDFPVGPARTVATRNYRLAAGAPLTLEVARTDRRFLRFSRQGASPATVSALDVPTLKRWPLPPPVPGGEWFVRMEPAPIVAERYRVTGPWGGELRPSARQIVARQGLPAGDYQVVPVYRGGPTGRPIAVRIVNTQSSVGLLPHEPVGAVAAGVDPSVCGQVTGFSLDRVRQSSGERSTARQVESIVRLSGHDCFPTVAGLAPGRYTARFSSATGPIGAQDVTVAAQRTSTVYIEANGATVSGLITLNDQPFAGVTVQFRRGNDTEGEPHEAQTDGDGRYSLSVGQAGAYVMTLRSGDALVAGPLRRPTLLPGDNTVDWALSGGTIVIRLPNWDRRTTTYLTLGFRRSSGADLAISRRVWTIGSETEYPIRVRGVPFATYYIWAQQPGGLVSRDVEVTIDKDRPDATAEVELVQNRSTILVRDEAGSPVPGTRVAAVGLAVEVEPGRFSMAQVPAGTTLLVSAPGFVPVCRRCVAEGEDVVTLARGRPVRVLFSRSLVGVRRPTRTSRWVSRIGLPGTAGVLRVPTTAGGRYARRRRLGGSRPELPGRRSSDVLLGHRPAAAAGGRGPRRSCAITIPAARR